MRQLLEPLSQDARAAPASVRGVALRHRRQILKIVWDAAEGYPEEDWGCMQWSTRPFTVGMPCDGTTDPNAHYSALCLCRRLGLDYAALYDRAYAWQRAGAGDWIRRVTSEEWARIARETVVPHLSDLALRALLCSLYAINNRSVVETLTEEFERLGFDVSEWWHDRFEMHGRRGFRVIRGAP